MNDAITPFALAVQQADRCGLAHGRNHLRERRQQVKRLQENNPMSAYPVMGISVIE